MSDEYKCQKCKFFRKDTRTCKSKIGCIEESDPDDFELNQADIFERSPESDKTRREHFRDLTDDELARYIKAYVSNKCTFCIYKSDGGCTHACADGIKQWIRKRVGIYD